MSLKEFAAATGSKRPAHEFEAALERCLETIHNSTRVISTHWFEIVNGRAEPHCLDMRALYAYLHFDRCRLEYPNQGLLIETQEALDALWWEMMDYARDICLALHQQVAGRLTAFQQMVDPHYAQLPALQMLPSTQALRRRLESARFGFAASMPEETAYIHLESQNFHNLKLALERYVAEVKGVIDAISNAAEKYEKVTGDRHRLYASRIGLWLAATYFVLASYDKALNNIAAVFGFGMETGSVLLRWGRTVAGF